MYRFFWIPAATMALVLGKKCHESPTNGMNRRWEQSTVWKFQAGKHEWTLTPPNEGLTFVMLPTIDASQKSYGQVEPVANDLFNGFLTKRKQFSRNAQFKVSDPQTTLCQILDHEVHQHVNDDDGGCCDLDHGQHEHKRSLLRAAVSKKENKDHAGQTIVYFMVPKAGHYTIFFEFKVRRNKIEYCSWKKYVALGGVFPWLCN